MLQLQECLKPSPKYILLLKNKKKKNQLSDSYITIFAEFYIQFPVSYTELQCHSSSKESIPNCW